MKTKLSSSFLFRVLYLFIAFVFCTPTGLALAAEPISSPRPSQTDLNQIFTKRLELFEQVSLITGIPWTYFAAIDQYERSLRLTRKLPVRNGLIDIYISESDWTGT